MIFNASDSEPTPTEYNEIKGMDIDPNTFDKATHKRLRSMGAKHEEIKDALKRGAFIEDYLDARTNHPDHEAAVDEALKYQQNHYREAVDSNKAYANSEGGLQDAVKPASDAQVLGAAQRLFSHHLAMKFNPGISDPEVKRGHEWILSEIAKICPHPALKKYVTEPDKYENNRVLSSEEHDANANALMHHCIAKRFLADNVKDYVIANRMVNAANNIGASRNFASEYSHDKYEED